MIERRPRPRDEVRQQRHRVRLVQHDEIGVGAREPERQGRSHGDGANRQPARDARDGHTVHDVVSRLARAVHHERVRLDDSLLSATQRLQRRLHAALLRRIELSEMQNSQAAHAFTSAWGARPGHTREHLSIDVDGGPGVRPPVEALRPRGAFRLPPTPGIGIVGALVEKRGRGRGPSLHVTGRTVGRRRAADLTKRRQVAGHDRRAAGHGLGDRQTEPFAVRGLQQQRGASIDGRQHAPIDEGKHRRRGRPGQAGRRAAAGWS